MRSSGGRMSSTSDPKDDVDRLFACFKCGLSTPESAMKERKMRGERPKKQSFIGGELSEITDVQLAGTSNPLPQNSLDKPVMSKSMAIKFNGVKHLSPVVFYGSPHGVPVKKPLQLLRLLREIHVDLSEQNDFTGREVVWATFPRQEEAVRFAKTHKQVHVFSYQDHLNGQRRFLVSNYEEFWQRYKKMDSKVRHHYEVIQEGLPCHLYFDLEFNRRDNPGRNVNEMVDILVSISLDALFDKYAIRGSQDWVIELDSSTEEKFSRHLIIRIPQTAFKDNSHAGTFVSEICSRIGSLCEKDPQLDKLYIRKDSGCVDLSHQLFVDTAVYSRNRCFRLALSSKAGKNSVLLPTSRFKCKNMSEKEMFMESLICRMDVDCKKLLVCKLDVDFKKTLFFDSEVNGNSEQNPEVLQEVALHPCTSNFTGPCFTGKSPFPALDSFVESIASTQNISGKIRSWYWFSEYGLMVYSMSRNRYCERIGREHKSNHVMYVVDFKTGGYYQKCYDPDCKGYRSPLRPIPRDVVLDEKALLNLTKMKNYKEVMSINFDLHVGESNVELGSTEDGEWITDSCKDRGWWQEAIRYADCIENMKRNPEFSDMLDEGWDEDYKWWMDADKIISQVEQQIS